MAGQRCSSTGVPAATPTPKPAIRPARQTWRSRDLTALHLVCRRFLIRINCLARLPVRPKLDSESLSCPLCLWFLFTFPAQSPLASGCFLSGRAFYILPPASVTSVQTCGWDTALLAFPSPVTPIQHSPAVFQGLRGPRLFILVLPPGRKSKFVFSVILQSLGMLGINHSVVETIDDCPAKKPHKRNLKLIICMKSRFLVFGPRRWTIGFSGT